MKSQADIQAAITRLTEQKAMHKAKSMDANVDGIKALHEQLAAEADCKLETLEWVLGELGEEDI